MNGERAGRGGHSAILVCAVVVLSLIVFVICTYLCLKKRGKICKKKQAEGQSFDEVD